MRNKDAFGMMDKEHHRLMMMMMMMTMMMTMMTIMMMMTMMTMMMMKKLLVMTVLRIMNYLASKETIVTGSWVNQNASLLIQVRGTLSILLLEFWIQVLSWKAYSRHGNNVHTSMPTTKHR